MLLFLHAPIYPQKKTESGWESEEESKDKKVAGEGKEESEEEGSPLRKLLRKRTGTSGRL